MKTNDNSAMCHLTPPYTAHTSVKRRRNVYGLNMCPGMLGLGTGRACRWAQVGQQAGPQCHRASLRCLTPIDSYLKGTWYCSASSPPLPSPQSTMTFPNLFTVKVTLFIEWHTGGSFTVMGRTTAWLQCLCFFFGLFFSLPVY